MSSTDYVQRPGMEPEYNLAFNTPALLDKFEQACAQIDINGAPPEVERASDTECSLLVDQYNVEFDSIRLANRAVALDSTGLHIEKIEDIAGSTAQHVPEGMAMVISAHRDLSALNDQDGLLDVCSVTASILKALDIPVPHYMPKPNQELVLALQTNRRNPPKHGNAVVKEKNYSRRNTTA